jgi:formylglycine-generating enzyme required for sulfatase activity
VPNAAQTDADGNGIGDACPFVAVEGAFHLAATEVTNDEYAAFLNAVAATDPNGLYNLSMGSNVRGGIDRIGASAPYTYAVKTNMGDKPVNFVSWLDAARYANWLHHGKPVGAQGPGTTQDGAYDLQVSNPGVNAIRSAGAIYYLPNDAEWVLAAYHDPSIGGDWTYPTRSNTPPILATADPVGRISNPGPNVANYGLGADWNGQDGNVTTVGSAGLASATYYGTYDQGGNVSEWAEDLTLGRRVVRGGSFQDASTFLRSDGGETRDFFVESVKTGFRVARRISCVDANYDGQPELPGEVAGLAIAKTPGATLSWSPEAHSTAYDLVSESISSLLVSGTSAATCLASDVSGTGSTDPRPDPTVGDGYYYLVRGSNGCGLGTWGSSSAGVPRATPAACP